ncbi:hypothetical protein Tco_0443908, partial [Tanacetum coccineum]
IITSSAPTYDWKDDTDVTTRNMGMYQYSSTRSLQGIWACIKGIVQLNAEQADWKDDTDDESDDQELEAHYMYMALIQEVTPNAAENSGPIFDVEPLHK